MKLDCLSCGACCFGPTDYVAVSGPDRDRMGPQLSGRYTVRRGDRIWLKMVHGHCAALRARQGHYSCRMYAERPTVCHIVEQGSRECLDARRRRGFETTER